MRERGLGLRLRMFYFKQIVHRNQLAAQLLAGLRICVFFQTGNDFVIFYDTEYFFVLKSYLMLLIFVTVQNPRNPEQSL